MDLRNADFSTRDKESWHSTINSINSSRKTALSTFSIFDNSGGHLASLTTPECYKDRSFRRHIPIIILVVRRLRDSMGPFEVVCSSSRTTIQLYSVVHRPRLLLCAYAAFLHILSIFLVVCIALRLVESIVCPYPRRNLSLLAAHSVCCDV